MKQFPTTAIAQRRYVGVTMLVIVILAGLAVAAPDIPIRHIVLDQELWRTDPSAEPYFRRLSQIQFDAEAKEYFVFDGGTTTFHVFSEAGDVIRTLELYGDGPGQARGVVDVRLLPDNQIGLLSAMGPSIVRVKRNGEAVYDQQSVTPFYSDTQSLSCCYYFDFHDGDFVLSGQQSVPGRAFLSTYSGDGDVQNDLLDIPAHTKIAEGLFDDHDDFLLSYKPWTLASNGLIYHAVRRNDQGRYRIRAVDFDGRVVFETSRLFESRHRTAREKDETRALHFSGYNAYLDFVDMGYDVIIPETEPDVIRIEEISDTLWVETGRSRDSDDAIVYDVFDLDGEFVEQVSVSCLTRPIGRDDLYFCGDTVVLTVGSHDAALGTLSTANDDLELRCYAFDSGGVQP